MKRPSELVVAALFGLTALFAAGFVVVYAADGLGNRTQLFGITLGGALLALAAACIVASKHLVSEEEVEEDYPEPEHPQETEKVTEILEQAGEGLTRKGLLIAAGSTAGAAVGAAVLVPALSLGPLLDTDSLRASVWRPGMRLIGEDGIPMFADKIEEGTFYTAFAERVDHDDLSASVVVVRLDPSALRLPPERSRWAPGGILAFSKICTHAGCAVSLYRKPTFPEAEPRPALVCPCHYSTFDPATGGDVVFGPAGRPLPQLPLVVGADGVLRAGGDFSAPPGPSWSGVRTRGPV